MALEHKDDESCSNAALGPSLAASSRSELRDVAVGSMPEHRRSMGSDWGTHAELVVGTSTSTGKHGTEALDGHVDES